ncbi:hypothetical protein COY28_00055 [Candidatus Woesearchaeota archaeon CG_4_10_14_0_2_um_filter_57_5]|nr:MAG: hypothetical protein AUJ68_05055 [Candidatus Woesearchaeota archaeon CG1_02_57_44]PIN70665.1 MAG: hypothetical protein COV94_01410 [Candidatus Woesearchaeota archaeon CG11_big_fil_rev_8_21_14_0_20_57_5]PIZ57605.1 MAG: hypothetical protein COY28_00055 [Candidatus Woesearchaeota archaeon CG_4_10_14_0_2_um_filter_57_5]
MDEQRDLVRALSLIMEQRTVELLKMFAANPEKLWYLKEAADQLEIPMASAHRILLGFADKKVLDESKAGRTRLYRMGTGKEAKILGGIFKEEVDPLGIFLKQISSLRQVEQVVLQGEPTKTRAFIIIVGNIVGTLEIEQVKRIIAEIRHEQGFTIVPTPMTKENFRNMLDMGMLGDNKIIWQKEKG